MYGQSFRHFSEQNRISFCRVDVDVVSFGFVASGLLKMYMKIESPHRMHQDALIRLGMAIELGDYPQCE
jgi:hypothetical protein